jgi:hypothetical protein
MKQEKHEKTNNKIFSGGENKNKIHIKAPKKKKWCEN